MPLRHVTGTLLGAIDADARLGEGCLGGVHTRLQSKWRARRGSVVCRQALPARSIERVLNGRQFLAVNFIGPRRHEGPHQDHAGFFHHPPRTDVDGIGERDDTPHAQFGEAFADQRARALGAVAFAPGDFAQPIAELGLVQGCAAIWIGAEVKPTRKSSLDFSTTAQKPKLSERV